MRPLVVGGGSVGMSYHGTTVRPAGFAHPV